MKGNDLVNRLRSKLRARTEYELAKRLGVSVMVLNLWRRRKQLTTLQIANLVSGLEGRILRAEAVLAQMKRKLSVDSDQQLARKIGMTGAALHGWRTRRFAAPQIANAIASALVAGHQLAEDNAIRPIVEFYPLEAADSRHGARMELFACATTGGDQHPYRLGLRDELKKHHGVYIFFDSRGRALYAGKAKRQSLWKEMCSAFNRGREVQRIKRVDHPERKVQYRTSNEKRRQIRPTQLALHDLAAYVSAYEVSPGLIGELESLLVRSFPNDLLNVRMERFDQQRALKGSTRKRSGRSRRRRR